MKAAAREAITKALAGLKPFQQATVEAAQERLLASEQRHLLIADETGLGKTVVARGLIARMLEAHLNSGKRKPLKVTYICSNQAIASENIEKLNFLPRELVTLRKGNRIAYMARAMEDQVGAQTVLEISTLTPGTSFQTSQSQGSRQERALIYNALLDGAPELRYRAKSVAELLRGGVRKESWPDDLNASYRKADSWLRLRKGFGTEFVNYLQEKQTSTFLSEWEQRNLLKEFASDTVLDLVRSSINQIQPVQCKKTHWYSNQINKILRRAMTQVCLKTVTADLYILDEFQRFDNLIRIHETDIDEQEPEERTIARAVFGDSSSKILMLSATPFKAYSGHDDQDGEDAHYRELLTVLKFLLNNDTTQLKEFEKHRRALYRQLASLKSGKVIEVDPVHKNGVEEILRPVICRTERIQTSETYTNLVTDIWQANPLSICRGDIKGYIATDQTIQQLSNIKVGGNFPAMQPLEYCKSTPYTFSFLHGYKIRRALDEDRFRLKPELRKSVKRNRNAWLDMKKMAKYNWSPRNEREDARSSRLSLLFEEALPDGSEKLLWVPPSLPYYPLEGPFKSHIGFSKTLVFSSWLMVPRMISTLLSYEVERMTIGDRRTVDNERDARKYFAAEGKRHPRPLFTFTIKSGDDDQEALLSRMTNFCLLYPSRVLAESVNTADELGKYQTLAELRRAVRGRIKKLFDEAGLSRYQGSGTSGERWYWMAPLLLDKVRDKADTERWLTEEIEQQPFDESDRTEKEKGFFRGGRSQYFLRLRDNFCSPESAGLGQMPKDLMNVLADMAIGSPAMVAYRTLQGLQPDPSLLRSWALKIADGFITLFNKPESIAAIRLANLGHPDLNHYWRQTINYCVEGCLQSVLDEYLHLLSERFADKTELVLFLRDSISINTNSVRVDDINWYLAGSKKDPPMMRTHVAVQLGNQRLETPEGEKRIASLRQNFNSPFRPFVMATTSIGQEGFDFHAYCRRIVHWNLPANPIDLEQREGRINRYKGLTIRQELGSRYGKMLSCQKTGANNWDTLFDIARKHEVKSQQDSGLVPYWVVRTEKYPIERVVPLYPFSKDGARLKRILRTLAIYRLAFGQPRQAELIEYLQENFSYEEIAQIRAKLMIDLSPFNYRQQ